VLGLPPGQVNKLAYEPVDMREAGDRQVGQPPQDADPGRADRLKMSEDRRGDCGDHGRQQSFDGHCSALLAVVVRADAAGVCRFCGRFTATPGKTREATGEWHGCDAAGNTAHSPVTAN
jgi:hypothetical protein